MTLSRSAEIDEHHLFCPKQNLSLVVQRLPTNYHEFLFSTFVATQSKKVCSPDYDLEELTSVHHIFMNLWGCIPRSTGVL